MKCSYHADGRHRYGWRKVFGKPGYFCLCQRAASEREVRHLEAAEAETQRLRNLDFGQEPGEQGGFPI